VCPRKGNWRTPSAEHGVPTGSPPAGGRSFGHGRRSGGPASFDEGGVSRSGYAAAGTWLTGEGACPRKGDWRTPRRNMECRRAARLPAGEASAMGGEAKPRRASTRAVFPQRLRGCGNLADRRGRLSPQGGLAHSKAEHGVPTRSPGELRRGRCFPQRLRGCGTGRHGVNHFPWYAVRPRFQR
jgi:hypothetical protein